VDDDGLESVLHLPFEITEVVLDGTRACERCGEFDVLTILGEHTFGSSVRTWARFLELHAAHTIEAIAEVLVNLLRVVTVGEDIEEGLVRDEVESWEDLLLLLKVLVKSPLAKIDLGDEILEDLVTAISVGGGDD
jgi:hypothetical protein